MKMIKYIELTVIALLMLLMVGCEKEAVNTIDINASVFKNGVADDGNSLLLVNRTDTLEFKFEITSTNADIRKVELWQYEGTGINTKQPLKIRTWEVPADSIGRSLIISSATMSNMFIFNKDIRYSVYVEDVNKNFSSAKVEVYTDISSYSYIANAIYNGNVESTSKTFVNLQSGRLFTAGNTISDPEGIDFGFAFLGTVPKGAAARACLVSFDQYWRTGIYNMFENQANAWTKFRKVTGMTAGRFVDIHLTNDSLRTIFENATVLAPPDGLGFDPLEERIASRIFANDYYAIQTKNGRFGLLQIIKLSTLTKGSENMQLNVLISKKID
jgi:hypothetical protein